MEVKSNEETRKNWEDSHSRVAAMYTQGIKRAKDVIAKAIAGEDLYAQKLQETIASKKRARKLAEVTDEQWRSAALDKGSKRIAQGMSASKEKFGKGIAPVLETLRGITLPPRTADGLANVDNRVKPIVAALMKLKE